MRTAIRIAGAAIGLGVLVLANAGCARDVLPTSHGLHGAALRSTSYHHLAFTEGVTVTGAGAKTLSAFAIAPLAGSDVPAAAAPAPAAPALEAVDIPGAVRDVERIPAELGQLRRLLMYGALGVLVCGGLNAVLLTAILVALLRRPAPVPVRRTPETDASAAAPIVRCGCGTPISVRSRTGRCRRCALAHNRSLAAGDGLRSLEPAS